MSVVHPENGRHSGNYRKRAGKKGSAHTLTYFKRCCFSWLMKMGKSLINNLSVTEYTPSYMSSNMKPFPQSANPLPYTQSLSIWKHFTKKMLWIDRDTTILEKTKLRHYERRLFIPNFPTKGSKHRSSPCIPISPHLSYYRHYIRSFEIWSKTRSKYSNTAHKCMSKSFEYTRNIVSKQKYFKIASCWFYGWPVKLKVCVIVVFEAWVELTREL